MRKIFVVFGMCFALFTGRATAEKERVAILPDSYNAIAVAYTVDLLACASKQSAVLASVYSALTDISTMSVKDKTENLGHYTAVCMRRFGECYGAWLERFRPMFSAEDYKFMHNNVVYFLGKTDDLYDLSEFYGRPLTWNEVGNQLMFYCSQMMGKVKVHIEILEGALKEGNGTDLLRTMLMADTVGAE